MISRVLASACLFAACAEPPEPAETREQSAEDSLFTAREVCRDLAKDKLTTPTKATFEGPVMKRHSGTNAFAGRGEVTAPNALGVPITHRFVCLLDIDGSGRGNVVLRESAPELYAETVRLFGLDE